MLEPQAFLCLVNLGVRVWVKGRIRSRVGVKNRVRVKVRDRVRVEVGVRVGEGNSWCQSQGLS